MTTEAENLISRHNAMVQERALVDPFYECAAMYFDPLRSHWYQGNRTSNKSGPTWNGDLYSGAGIVSLSRFTNFLQGNATPSTSRWLDLQDASIANPDTDVMQWYADCTRIIDKSLRGTATRGGSFYVSKRNEYKEMALSYGVTFIFEGEEDGLTTGEAVHQKVPSYAFYYQMDDFGRIAACSYARQMTDDQAQSIIGKSVTDAETEEQKAKKSSDRKTILQMVIRNPNGKVKPRSIDEFPFREYWIDVAEKKILKRKGYRSQPFHVTGWHQVPNSNYFVGPCYDALPDMVSAAAARRSQINAMEWAGTPPLLGGSKIEGAAKTLRPRRITWNAVGRKGNAMIQALSTATNPAPLFQQVQDDEARVRSLMGNDELLHANRPNMSATEANIVSQERAAMVAPFADVVVPAIRGQISRVFEIMLRAGVLPEPPRAVVEQGEFDVDVIGPLALASRSAQVGSMMQTLDQAAYIEQMQSQYLDKEEALKKVMEQGGHGELLRDFAIVNEEMQAAAEQQAQMAEAAIAQQQVDVAKGIAETGQMTGEGELAQ